MATTAVIAVALARTYRATNLAPPPQTSPPPVAAVKRIHLPRKRHKLKRGWPRHLPARPPPRTQLHPWPPRATACPFESPLLVSPCIRERKTQFEIFKKSYQNFEIIIYLLILI